MAFDDTLDPNYNADNPQSGASQDNYGETVTANSPSSSSGGGFNLTSFLTGATGVANAGNTLYSAITGKKPAAPAKTTTTASSLTKYLPYIIGGGILLVFGVLLTRKK